MIAKTFRIENPSPAIVATAIGIFLLYLVGMGLLAWWAFSWSTHTLAWFIFVFTTLLGGSRVVRK